MLERALEWLERLADRLRFAVVLNEWERGVVLRLGRHHRTIGPGFHWVLPFGVDQVVQDAVCTTVTKLSPQSLTTSDGHNVVVAATVTWEVSDVETLLLRVAHRDHALLDSAPSVIAALVRRTAWDALFSEEFAGEVTKKVRARAKRYGLHVQEVALRDCVRTRTLRLITSQAYDEHDREHAG